MADVELHVKPKSKWKKVEINKGLGTGHDFSGLICMEELTDYEIITQTQPREETKVTCWNGFLKDIFTNFQVSEK